jgi:hypothetical protein
MTDEELLAELERLALHCHSGGTFRAALDNAVARLRRIESTAAPGTPRTDALFATDDLYEDRTTEVASLARQLERENAELERQLEIYQAVARQNGDDLDEVRATLEQAERALEAAQKENERQIGVIVQQQKQINRLAFLLPKDGTPERTCWESMEQELKAAQEKAAMWDWVEDNLHAIATFDAVVIGWKLEIIGTQTSPTEAVRAAMTPEGEKK